MERRLGRGLGSLLSQGTPAEEPPTAELDVDAIRPNPFQPRSVFREDELEELTTSIRNHGILQPVAVRRAGDGYELISGERRWRAAQAVGLQRIPATVRPDVSDAAMLELALVENLQRVDLDPIERARGFQKLVETLSLTQEQVAAKVGLKRSTVANHLRLLDLPEAVQQLVSRGLVSMGHARAILGLSGADARARLAAQVAREELSVRETERRVRDLGTPRASKEKPQASEPALPPWGREMQDRMRDALGTRVHLRNGPEFRGQIVIDYFGREELERLYERLAPKPRV